MFALEMAGELYLKTDAATEPLFRSAGSSAFAYNRRGKTVQTSYWRLPDVALGDPDQAARWAKLALEAARRSAARKATGRRR